MLDVRLVDLLETFHLDQSDDALKLAAEVGRQGPKLLGCILVDDNNTPVSQCANIIYDVDGTEQAP